MKLIKYPLKALDGILDRVCAVIGAITMSQIPAFILHYLQRLGGHVDEAKRNVAGWQAIADTTTGGSIDKLIANYGSSEAAEVLAAGKKCVTDVARLEDLQDAFCAITDASAWARPFAFLRNMDIEISRATLSTYTPNAPIDLPSLAYAAVGLVLAVLLYKGLKLFVRTMFRSFSRKRKVKDVREDDAQESGDGC